MAPNAIDIGYFKGFDHRAANRIFRELGVAKGRPVDAYADKVSHGGLVNINVGPHTNGNESGYAIQIAPVGKCVHVVCFCDRDEAYMHKVAEAFNSLERVNPRC